MTSLVHGSSSSSSSSSSSVSAMQPNAWLRLPEAVLKISIPAFLSLRDTLSLIGACNRFRLSRDFVLQQIQLIDSASIPRLFPWHLPNKCKLQIGIGTHAMRMDLATRIPNATHLQLSLEWRFKGYEVVQILEKLPDLTHLELINSNVHYVSLDFAEFVEITTTLQNLEVLKLQNISILDYYIGHEQSNEQLVVEQKPLSVILTEPIEDSFLYKELISYKPSIKFKLTETEVVHASSLSSSSSSSSSSSVLDDNRMCVFPISLLTKIQRERFYKDVIGSSDEPITAEAFANFQIATDFCEYYISYCLQSILKQEEMSDERFKDWVIEAEAKHPYFAQISKHWDAAKRITQENWDTAKGAIQEEGYKDHEDLNGYICETLENIGLSISDTVAFIEKNLSWFSWD